MTRRLWPLVCGMAMTLTACQTLAGDVTKASVDLGDPATRASVTAVLAAAVGRAHIELGPVNDAETSVVSVLPPQPGIYEMNSPAKPVQFDIVLRDGRCVAVRRDTGTAYDLPGVNCKGG